MKYFKNTELAKLYNVSEKSVRNWIDAAEAGKLGIQLFEKGGKHFVANTTVNLALVKDLADKGQKYKNTRGFKVVEPSPKFYERYNSRQIFEIISSLNIHKELPLQYNYFAEGADDWNKYAERLSKEDAPNMLTSCQKLLDTNLDDIERLIGGCRRVNVIDIGIGNCLPVKNLVDLLIKKGILNRYIGIDISKSMLDIAEQNMKKWFGGKAKFEFYERDISHEEFGDLIAQDYFGSSEDRPINLVLFLGGTIANFEVPDDVLRIIHRSIQPEDMFVLSLKLDTPNSRRFFDLHHDPTQIGQLASWQSSALGLLNIDDSLYEVEQIYNEEKGARFISAKLKVDVSVKFKLNEGEHAITLRKGDSILLLRYRHQTALGVMRLFDKNGFDILQTSKSRDQEYFLIVSEVSETSY